MVDTDAPDVSAPKLDVALAESGPGSIQMWRDCITRDESLRKKKESLWKENVRRYKGAKAGLTNFGVSARETIAVNIDYANAEQKKALLFFQSPEIQATPKRVDDVSAAPLVQAVINHYLLHEVDAYPMVQEVLTDLIVPAGMGVSVIGYDAYVDGEMPMPGPDGQPAMGPDGQPLMVPNIVREAYYWDRVTPMKVIIPASFTGMDYDKAPYLGYEFLIDEELCKARFGTVPQQAKATQDDNRLTQDPDQQQVKDMIRGYCIWYRSSVYRTDVSDPERFTQLVLAMGAGDRRSQAEVLVHRDSPYQKLDDRGRVVSGMRGNPIHILTTRYVSDDPYPPSDCSMSRAQVDELSLCRSQMVQQRRRSMPMRWVNVAVDPAAKQTIERMERGETQSIIPLMGNGNEIAGSFALAAYPRENFQFQDYLEKDIAREWALGVNQNGVAGEDANTATEASIMQKNTDTRLSAERAKVLRWYVRGAEKLFSLLQLFATDTELVPIIGQDGSQTLQKWNRDAIGGLYRFDARPDSSIRMDAAQELDKFLRYYNLTANDPNVRRIELDKELARKMNLDPGRLVVEQPPQPPPDQPKLSLSFNGTDLNPGMPQAAVVASILKAQGITIDPQAVQMGAAVAESQPEHPGAVPRAATLDQHAADRSGERSGPKVGE